MLNFAIPISFSRDEPDSTESSNEHPAIECRQIAYKNLEKQAARMLKRSEKKLCHTSIGNCVTVSVPEFDRGRGAPLNVVGVVMEIDDISKKFKIGTRAGIIETYLERNSFEVVNFKGLRISDVPQKELSLRTIVKEMSIGVGQGFRKCSCKTNCATNKCCCFKDNFKCNSACHTRVENKNCTNHD